MRKTILCITAAFATALSLYAGVYLFDPQSNDNLRSDMITFVSAYRSTVEGSLIAEDLDVFLAEVNATKTSAPYDWIDRTLRFVEFELALYPTTGGHVSSDTDTGPASVRRFLLELKDYPLHTNNQTGVDPEPESGQADAFNQAKSGMLKRATQRLINWLDTPAPTAGTLEIFKLYNMGIVVRSANHCVAFDINWNSTAADADKLCNKIEALFTTHSHGDHYSTYVLSKMTALTGKTLFMDTNLPGTAKYTDSGNATIYKWSASQTTAVDVNGIKVRAAMGSQGTDVPCLCWCVEMDGWCLWICGDNTSTDATTILKSFAAPDLSTVSLASDFSDLCLKGKLAAGASSKDRFFLPAHENELSHGVISRISWKFFFESTEHGIAKPAIKANMGPILNLDCGEHITLSK